MIKEDQNYKEADLMPRFQKLLDVFNKLNPDAELVVFKFPDAGTAVKYHTKSLDNITYPEFLEAVDKLIDVNAAKIDLSWPEFNGEIAIRFVLNETAEYTLVLKYGFSRQEIAIYPTVQRLPIHKHLEEYMFTETRLKYTNVQDSSDLNYRIPLTDVEDVTLLTHLRNNW